MLQWHCHCTPHVYPFFYWWTLRSVLHPLWLRQCCDGGQITPQHPVIISVDRLSQGGVTNPRAVFQCRSHCSYRAALLYIPPRHARVPSPDLCPHLLSSQFHFSHSDNTEGRASYAQSHSHSEPENGDLTEGESTGDQKWAVMQGWGQEMVANGHWCTDREEDKTRVLVLILGKCWVAG